MLFTTDNVDGHGTPRLFVQTNAFSRILLFYDTTTAKGSLFGGFGYGVEFSCNPHSRFAFKGFT